MAALADRVPIRHFIDDGPNIQPAPAVDEFLQKVYPARFLYSAPGLEDLWQIHFSLLSGQEYTAPGMFIANSA